MKPIEELRATHEADERAGPLPLGVDPHQRGQPYDPEAPHRLASLGVAAAQIYAHPLERFERPGDLGIAQCLAVELPAGRAPARVEAHERRSPLSCSLGERQVEIGPPFQGRSSRWLGLLEPHEACQPEPQ